MNGSVRWWCLSCVLVLSSSAGCGGDGSCTQQAQEFCHLGVVYWADSCGNLGDAKDYCQCGCNDNQSACRSCTCSCSTDDACCDGCLPIREGHVCDDGDPDTVTDICTDGVCAGWDPDDIPEPTPPAEPALPAEPEPPHLRSWTCPENWLAVEHEDLLDENGDPFSWCEPPPLPRLKVGTYVTPLKDGEQEGDRPICEPEVDGTFPLLGFDTCQPLGDPCPAGDWPEIPPEVTGNRIHVLAGASGGSGTEADPFGTIEAAVSAAVSGDVVVIGAGTYPESLTVDRNLTLWGKCVKETIIDAPGPYGGLAAAAVLVNSDANANIFNLTITGEQQGVFVDGSSASASLQGVWIRGVMANGIVVEGGDIVTRQVLIESTRPNSSGYYGRGLAINEGSSSVLVMTTFEANRETGVMLWNRPGETIMERIAIRETGTEENRGIFGYGIFVYGGAALDADRVLVESFGETGILAAEPGSIVSAQNLVVRESQGLVDGTEGSGMKVANGAEVALDQAWFERNRHVCLWLHGSNTKLEADNLVVSDTLPQISDQGIGRGLYTMVDSSAVLSSAFFQRNHEVALMAQTDAEISAVDLVVENTLSDAAIQDFGNGASIDGGGRLSIQRGWFRRNRNVGIYLYGSATRALLIDVSVEDTRPRERDELLGMGVVTTQGAQLTMERALLSGNREIGLSVEDPASMATLTDLTIKDTTGSQRSKVDGVGLYASNGSTVSMLRVQIARNRAAGIDANGTGTNLDIEDLTVEDTESQESDSMFGFGMSIHAGAHLTLARGRFTGNRSVGVFAESSGTVLDMEDVTITDTRSEEASLHLGRGIHAQIDAQISLQRAHIEGNREAGILSTGGAHLDAEDVVILDTRSIEAGLYYGVGFAVAEGGHATLSKSRIEQSRATGINVYGDGTSLSVEDSVIQDTFSSEATLSGGEGLTVHSGAQVTMSRTRLERNRELGIFLAGEDSDLQLNQVVIDTTLPRACYELPANDLNACPTQPAGSGIAVTSDASLLFSGVEIVDSFFIGLQMASMQTVEGNGLSITRCPIGVNLQDIPEGYDFLESVTGLRMEGNQVNFDTNELPVPDPSLIIE